MSKRFIHFSRFGAYLGELTPLQATRTRNVDQCGVDKVELVLLDNGVDKYDRIVFCDSTGRTCEWIVMSSRESRAKSVPVCTVNCYGSMQELSRHFMPTLRRGSKDTPAQALAKALDGTRWSVGQCDEGSGEYSVYHQSSLASVNDIANAYKMEVKPVIQLSADGNSIAKRSVCLVKRLGRSNTALRLDYGSGLSGIDRVLSADDVVTRLYCYGKGVQTTDDDGNETGGYSRKITFADINGGKEYIQDDSLLEVWGVPGPDGSLMHTEGIFEDGDCEDKATLLAEGRAALAERSKPIVSYEGTVEALGRAGFDANACDLGDNLQMVDTTFPKPLRLSGRVLEIVEDLLGDGSPSSVKVGNVIEGIIKRSEHVQQTIDRLTSSAGSWDSAATLGSAYLDGLIDGLNKVMNETGGYTYIKPGKGLFVYDKPESDNPTMCIQIGGGYFRIADGKNSDGTWNFRTLGNGHGLVADAIVSGAISGNLIKAGTIQDKAGKNYWNLETGYLRTTRGSIGGFTIDRYDISNNHLSLRNDGPHFIYDGKDIGFIGTNGLVGHNDVYGLNFDLNDTGGYMTWAAKENASDTSYWMKLTYANKPNIGFTAHALNAGCDLDMRNWSIKNIGNGITRTLSLCVITNANSDGSFTYSNGCNLKFEGGLLTNFTWPSGSYS